MVGDRFSPGSHLESVGSALTRHRVFVGYQAAKCDTNPKYPSLMGMQTFGDKLYAVALETEVRAMMTRD